MSNTPIYDQVRREHAAKAAAAANTDPEGRQLVAAIHKAKQETTDVRWMGLPWLRSGRG